MRPERESRPDGDHHGGHRSPELEELLSSVARGDRTVENRGNPIIRAGRFKGNFPARKGKPRDARRRIVIVVIIILCCGAMRHSQHHRQSDS